MFRPDNFAVVGVSHWFAPLEVRERFALNADAVEALLREAQSMGVDSLMAVSTCNRTELFLHGDRTEVAIGLLVKHSTGTRNEFAKHGFIKRGEDALRHLFRVAVGLDAQILGDLQIIQQVKQAYETACQFGHLDAVMHRTLQSVFRAHKRSRTETDLGTGAASTAYAAVQASRAALGTLEGRRVLLVGTGEVGKVTCLNLHRSGVADITLVNRTRDRAMSLAAKVAVNIADWDALDAEIAAADLIIVATGADHPVITPDRVDASKGPKVFMDLAVPRNVDPAIEQLDGIRIINMDMLNDRLDATYQERAAQVPRVEAIIEEEIADLRDWMHEQRVVPTIKALTARLDAIRAEELDRYRSKFSADDAVLADQLTRRIVNKILAYSIDHLKDEREEAETITRVVRGLFKIGPDP